MLFRSDADGWVTVDIRFDIELQARAYALGFGAQLEIISPPELRETVMRLAQATLMLYQA